MNKRIGLVRLFVFVAMAICMASCADFKEIKVTSCEVKSFTPQGFRSVDAVLLIGVDNPARSFRLTDIEAVVYYDEKEMATLTSDSIQINGKTSDVYEIPCVGTLADKVSLIGALAIAGAGEMSHVTMDVSARVSTGKGKGKRMEYKVTSMDAILKGEKTKEL